MFEHPGDKIKKLAKIMAIIEISAAVVAGYALAAERESFDILFLIIFAGFLFAWFSNLALYAFGELVENSTLIATAVRPTIKNSTQTVKNTSRVTWSAPNCSSKTPETESRSQRLAYLYEKGVISDEEYHREAQERKND